MGMGVIRDLGPCQIDWGATNLGAIFGDVKFSYSDQSADVFEAAYGNTPVDSVFTGAGLVEVVVPFTRMSLANLLLVIPGGCLSGTSGVFVKTNSVGMTMYDLSKPLFIKPVVAGVASANGNWLRLEHAYPMPEFDITFNNSDQRVYNVRFKGFPDATTRKSWSVGKVNITTT